MGSMSNQTTPPDKALSDNALDEKQWRAIDDRVKRVDEDRWISSRYAPDASRRALIALYALAYELARVRLAVSEETLGNIRFQWWRDALEEIEAGKPSRAHDVCLAIAEECAAGRLKIGALQKLVDGYEAAFESEDRAREPEAWLAATAANILMPIHNWGTEIQTIAPAYAAVRRNESKAFGEIVKAAPKPIRPAIAHFRLRKFYYEGKTPGPIKKRLSILKAIRTGEV